MISKRQRISVLQCLWVAAAILGATTASDRALAQANYGGSGFGTSPLGRDAGYPGSRRIDDETSNSSLIPTPSGVTAAWKSMTGQGPDAEAAKLLYLQGDELFQQALSAPADQRKSLYEAAADKFEKAGGRWPDSALEQDALYMAGESWFFADRYSQANEQYEKLLKAYPSTRYLDIANARRFALARYWLSLNEYSPDSSLSINYWDGRRPWRDTFGHAVRVFDKIRLDDPTGRLADDATMAAANAHFARGDYYAAADFYEDLRKTFPSSEHQFHAHLLGIQATMKTYQGPDYDGAALEKAQRLIDRVRKQFRRESEQHREFLAAAEHEVRTKKAERLWAAGKYYDRRAQYGGARFHYRQLVQEYPDIPEYAQPARKRLEKIADRPDSPPQRLSWLVDAFPTPPPAKPLFPSDTPSFQQ